MMISTRYRFGFICVPKCASTSIESYIRKNCNFILSGTPKLKHLSYIEYEENILPLLEQKGFPDIKMFAVIRNPVDWAKSWYSYRSRKDNGKPLNPRAYIENMSFDEFAEQVIAKKPKGYANIHSQSHYLANKQGEIGVDTLFTVRNVAEKLPEFLAKNGLTDLGEMPVKNRSPEAPRDEVSKETVEKLKEHFARDWELYDKYS